MRSEGELGLRRLETIYFTLVCVYEALTELYKDMSRVPSTRDQRRHRLSIREIL